ncbi:MAG: T9SS type A sorting domain-containing protein, partial [Fidelibacterota bacterium]
SILVCQNSAWSISELPLDKNGWIMTNGDAFQSRTIKGVSPVPNPDQDPLLFKTQTYAYPNPAKAGNVTFRITVGTAERVEVEVYSLAGYFVKRWALSDLIPMLPNEIRWDVSDREPGIYFARIIAYAGTETETKILKLGIVN